MRRVCGQGSNGSGKRGAITRTDSSAAKSTTGSMAR